MRTSKHLAVGLALCLGLVACGQDSKHDSKDAANPAALVQSGTAEEQLSALVESSKSDMVELRINEARLSAEIEKIQTEISSTEDAGKVEQLNKQLSDLKTEYNKNQEAISDAENYEMLLRFVVDTKKTPVGIE